MAVLDGEGKWHMTNTELLKQLLIVVTQADNEQHTVYSLVLLAEPSFII